jgi:hypothetical protein
MATAVVARFFEHEKTGVIVPGWSRLWHQSAGATDEKPYARCYGGSLGGALSRDQERTAAQLVTRTLAPCAGVRGVDNPRLSS